MYAMELDNPLTQEKIDSLKVKATEDLSETFWTYRKIGGLVTVIFILCLEIVNRNLANKEQVLYATICAICAGFGAAIALLPELMGSSIKNSVYSEYIPASDITIHNCKAYANMPGMEAYKEYVEKVNKQGRTLTNLECNTIRKAWYGLAAK